MTLRSGHAHSLVLAVATAVGVGIVSSQVCAAPEPLTTSTPSPAPKAAPVPKRAQLPASYLQTVRWITTQARQKCWQPALKARAPGAPGVARVSMTITTAASGRVQSVRTTKASQPYPTLAACIEREVRGWTFPRSSEKTVAHVPFVFSEPLLIMLPGTPLGCIGAQPFGVESTGDPRNSAP